MNFLYINIKKTIKIMLTFDTFEQYRQMDAVNASLLKDLRKSPLNAFGVEVVKDSAAMYFGRMFHSFILESETFKNYYYPYDENERAEPEKTMASKLNKEWKLKQVEEAAGKQLITRGDIQQLADMRNVIRTFAEPALQLIDASEKEASLYMNIDIDGDELSVKCRFDAINIERGAIIDLKTTNDATTEGFNREAGKYAYHVQTAFYLRLAELAFNRPFKFYILSQETKAPYNMLLREVSDSMRQKGDFEINKLIPAAAHIMKTGELKSYNVFTDDPLGIVPLDIPDYFVMNHDFNFKDKKIA